MPGLTWTILPTAGMTDMHHHPQPLVEITNEKVLVNFLLGWPQTMIFLISASQVARIIDVTHCASLILFLNFSFTYCPQNVYLRTKTDQALLPFRAFIQGCLKNIHFALSNKHSEL
jgi:hypothetical protein